MKQNFSKFEEKRIMRTIKTFFLFIFFIVSSYNITFSQTDLWDNFNHEFTNFCYNDGICNDQCWNIDTSNHQNIWQSGPTNKVFLGSYTPFFPTFITDTLNFYPSNNSSSFEFLVHDYPDAPFYIDCYGIIEIIINDMLDTDTLKDGGFIEISFDNK